MSVSDIVELEASLRNFVIDSLGTSDQGLIGKCRSLKLVLDCSDRNRLAFKVQMGCMESLFDIKDGVKHSGALGGGVDRIIPKWFMRIGAKEKFAVLVRDYIAANKEIKTEKEIEY